MVLDLATAMDRSFFLILSLVLHPRVCLAEIKHHKKTEKKITEQVPLVSEYLQMRYVDSYCVVGGRT